SDDRRGRLEDGGHNIPDDPERRDHHRLNDGGDGAEDGHDDVVPRPRDDLDHRLKDGGHNIPDGPERWDHNAGDNSANEPEDGHDDVVPRPRDDLDRRLEDGGHDLPDQLERRDHHAADGGLDPPEDDAKTFHKQLRGNRNAAPRPLHHIDQPLEDRRKHIGDE